MLVLPEQISSEQLYKLLVGGVTPRPIAWVSSLSKQGIANLAPFSFFTVASVQPPILCFNPMYTDESHAKDTLNNIREQGEFVVNSVSYADMDAMNRSCHAVASEVDEFDYADVERLPSLKVSPSRIASAIISFECRMQQIIDLGEGALSGHLVLGEILAIHAKDEAIEGFKINSDKLDAIGRMAGSDYTLTRQRVQLDRN